MNNEQISDMLSQIIQGKNTEALENFNTLISDKIDTALASKKIEIASTLGATQDESE